MFFILGKEGHYMLHLEDTYHCVATASKGGDILDKAEKLFKRYRNKETYLEYLRDMEYPTVYPYEKERIKGEYINKVLEDELKELECKVRGALKPRLSFTSRRPVLTIGGDKKRVVFKVNK